MDKPNFEDIIKWDKFEVKFNEDLENGYNNTIISTQYKISYDTQQVINSESLQYANAYYYIELTVIKNHHCWRYLAEVDNDDQQVVGIIENDDIIENLIDTYEIEEE